MAALVIGFGKAKPAKASDPMQGEPDGDEGEDAKPTGKGPRLAFDGFADAAGIAPEQREEAYKALRAMVTAICAEHADDY